MTLDELTQQFLDACNDLDEDSLYVEHAGYSIELSREDENDCWYIQLSPFEQGFLYDGWWRDSEGKPIREALKQAISGSQILADFQ